MTCVSEQGKNGLLWTVFEGEPFCSRRIASFATDSDAREYLLLKQGHAGTMVEVRTVESLHSELSQLRRNVGSLYEWFQGNTNLTGHQKDAANAIFGSLEKGLREDKSEIVILRAERDELQLQLTECKLVKAALRQECDKRLSDLSVENARVCNEMRTLVTIEMELRTREAALQQELAAIRTGIISAESPTGNCDDTIDLLTVFIEHHKKKEAWNAALMAVARAAKQQASRLSANTLIELKDALTAAIQSGVNLEGV